MYLLFIGAAAAAARWLAARWLAAPHHHRRRSHGKRTNERYIRTNERVSVCAHAFAHFSFTSTVQFMCAVAFAGCRRSCRTLPMSSARQTIEPMPRWNGRLWLRLPSVFIERTSASGIPLPFGSADEYFLFVFVVVVVFVVWLSCIGTCVSFAQHLKRCARASNSHKNIHTARMRERRIHKSNFQSAHAASLVLGSARFCFVVYYGLVVCGASGVRCRFA